MNKEMKHNEECRYAESGHHYHGGISVPKKELCGCSCSCPAPQTVTFSVDKEAVAGAKEADHTDCAVCYGLKPCNMKKPVPIADHFPDWKYEFATRLGQYAHHEILYDKSFSDWA